MSELLANQLNVTLFEMVDIANEAAAMGIDMGRNRLFTKLREWHLIEEKPSTRPYQEGIDNKWFVRVLTDSSKRKADAPKKIYVTLVTVKGRNYLLKKLAKESGMGITISKPKNMDELITSIYEYYMKEDNLDRFVYRLIRSAHIHTSMDMYKHIRQAMIYYGNQKPIEYEELRPILFRLRDSGHIEMKGAAKHQPEWYATNKKGDKHEKAQKQG